MAADQPGAERWIGITPGTGTAVVGRRVAVLLAAGPDHPLVGELWAAVGEADAGFDETLAVLGSAGFDRLPDLVVAGWEDGSPRVVVRGDVAVAIGAGDGGDEVEITGSEVHSWAEHTVPGDATVHMRLGPQPRSAGSGSYVVDRGRLPAVALAVPAGGGPDAEAGGAGADEPVDEGEGLHATVLVGGLPERPQPQDADVGGSVRSEQPPGPPPPAPGVLVPPRPPGTSEAEPASLLQVPRRRTAPPTGPGRAARTAPGEADDDHTIGVEQLRRVLGAREDASAAARAGSPTADGGLWAVRCARGHLNPLHGHRCRVCDTLLSADDPEQVARPDLGVFRFSTGAVVDVVRPMLIGRAPRVVGEVRGEMPDLVAVPSPDQDISRTHLEVRLEGWQVLLVDRGSTNGTSVSLPGGSVHRLRPDQPYPLPLGAVVSLADEVELSFEAER